MLNNSDDCRYSHVSPDFNENVSNISPLVMILVVSVGCRSIDCVCVYIYVYICVYILILYVYTVLAIFKKYP